MPVKGPLVNETENIIFLALVECGKDYAKENNIEEEDRGIYAFLSETPLLVITVALRLKLEAFGFELTENVSAVIESLVEIEYER